MASSQLRDQLQIQRFGEPRVGHGYGQSVGLQQTRSFQSIRKACSERQDCRGASFSHYPAAPYAQLFSLRRQEDACAGASRISQRAGTVIDLAGGRNHVDEFGFIGRRHQHDVGQAAEIDKIEASRMGRPVGSHRSGAIDCKANRQPLDGDVMHDLVIGALKEGRIDSAKGSHAFGGQSGSKRYCMLLRDPDVEEP